MYAVSLRAQIKDGRIDELKEFIKNCPWQAPVSVLSDLRHCIEMLFIILYFKTKF